MNRKNKAVSPVVASLLLILIAVAAAVVLYAWVSNLNSSAKGSGAENTGNAFVIEEARLIKNLTRVNVDDLAPGPANNLIINATSVQIWLRNIANKPIDNGTWAAYLIDAQTGEVIAVADEWTFNKTLSPGEIYTNVTAWINGKGFGTENNTFIYFTNGTTLDISEDKYYIVKIVSPDGVADSVVIKPEEEVIA